jgi:hypothetical protein
MTIPHDINAPNLAQALLSRLCAPDALDPRNPTHCAGFTRALQRDPTLPIPGPLLEALTDRQLWQVVQQPLASRELQCRFRARTGRVDTPIKDDEILMTPLLPSLEAAIIIAYQARRLQSRDIDRLKKRFALRPATLRALADIAQQRESRRRSRQPSAVAPSLLDTIQGLLPPQGSHGAYWRLRDLPLERLSPQELATLLPQWITLDSRYVAPLLNVPGLDADTQALAFRAWVASGYHPCPRQPIPLHLVEATKASSLPPVLRLFLRDALDITPRPTRQLLDNLIFLVALDDPTIAADLRDARTLAAWRDELISLIEAEPDAPTATDPEARWLALCTKDANLDQQQATQLCAQCNQWPPARRRALAPIFLATIQFNTLI